MSGSTRRNGPQWSIISQTRLNRRSMLRKSATLLLGGGLIASTPGCGPISFGPNTQDTQPVETPAAIPDPEPTPEPDPTPEPGLTPAPEPDPTPTPEPIEQVLRIAGTLLDVEHQGVTELPACPRNPLVTAGLTQPGEQFEIEPDWAADIEPLEEQDGWRFRIAVNSDGWSDGSPVTAQDFVRHWMSLLDPEDGADPEVVGLLGDVENALAYRRGEVAPGDVGITAVNDWTLEVRLERVRETFPAAVSAMALRPRAGSNRDSLDDCLTNGHYTIDVQEDEDSLTVEPVEDPLLPNSTVLERVELTTMSPGIALTGFQQGDIHLVRLSGTDVIRVREDPLMGDMIREAQPDRIIMLLPNVEMPPFDQPEIRRALSRVIDRRRLELIVEGRISPASRLLPTGMFPDLDDAAAGITADFDVDAAYAELDDAGLGDTAEWPEFGLDIPSGMGFLDRVARDVATQFRENLDIRVPIRVHDPEEYAQGLRERRFSLAWFDWRYPYADPAATYLELFASRRPDGHPVSWSHPEYDGLLLAADEIVTAGQRASAWAGCEGLLQEHGACIPLVHPREFYLLQPWVEGIPQDGRDRLIIGDSLGLDLTRNVEILERPDE